MGCTSVQKGCWFKVQTCQSLHQSCIVYFSFTSYEAQSWEIITWRNTKWLWLGIPKLLHNMLSASRQVKECEVSSQGRGRSGVVLTWQWEVRREAERSERSRLDSEGGRHIQPKWRAAFVPKPIPCPTRSLLLLNTPVYTLSFCHGQGHPQKF